MHLIVRNAWVRVLAEAEDFPHQNPKGPKETRWAESGSMQGSVLQGSVMHRSVLQGNVLHRSVLQGNVLRMRLRGSEAQVSARDWH